METSVPEVLSKLIILTRAQGRYDGRLNATEAAFLLGVCSSRVRAFIAKDRLAADLDNYGDWRISPLELIEFDAKPRYVGRPIGS
jgi:hypothetical protein